MGETNALVHKGENKHKTVTNLHGQEYIIFVDTPKSRWSSNQRSCESIDDKITKRNGGLNPFCKQYIMYCGLTEKCTHP